MDFHRIGTGIRLVIFHNFDLRVETFVGRRNFSLVRQSMCSDNRAINQFSNHMFRLQKDAVPDRDRLTLDTKWIPSMPIPSFKSWSSRSREKLGGWLCLVHDRYGPELREALRMEGEIILQGQDQELRARSLSTEFSKHLLDTPRLKMCSAIRLARIQRL